MSARRFLLLPGLIRASVGAPRGAGHPWERYWSGIRRTGPDGDVLWDVAQRAEMDWCLAQARRFFDAELPVVDLGCGNGRFTRLFAEAFPAALGVDVAASAVRLAAAESGSRPDISYRQADATDPVTMRALAGEIGPANVFLRGVLHVNPPRVRAAMAEGIAAMVGERGRALLVESEFPGDPLAFMEYVGGGSGRVPALVRPLVRAGVPPPRRFGRRELDRVFPPTEWPRLDAGEAEMRVIDQDGERPYLRIPGFFAALRHKPA